MLTDHDRRQIEVFDKHAANERQGKRLQRYVPLVERYGYEL